jgi:hypothetical protein
VTKDKNKQQQSIDVNFHMIPMYINIEEKKLDKRKMNRQPGLSVRGDTRCFNPLKMVIGLFV